MTYGKIVARWLSNVILNNIIKTLTNKEMGRDKQNIESKKAILRRFEIRLAEVIDEILREDGSLQLRIDESGTPDKIIASVAKETNLKSISNFTYPMRKRICIDVDREHIVVTKGNIIRVLR